MKRALLLLPFVAACSGTNVTALYPPRPAATPAAPVADPPPSRIVIHASVAASALQKILDQKLPATGEGSFVVMGSQRKYKWTREKPTVRFDKGTIGVTAKISATVDLVANMDFALKLDLVAEPVISSSYVARLQSLQVNVTSDDKRLKVAQGVAGLMDTLKQTVEQQARDFAFDLKPAIAEAHGRIAKPIDINVGDAKGCAELKIVGVEAGPTVLADGVEKDLAIVITPGVTLPCATNTTPSTMPPLANVASLPTGPFSVTVPIAANYTELQRAMTAAFTNGKLFFSKEFPELYLEKPEVYSSKDAIILKLHINGKVNKYGLNVNLDGDLFMAGHPTVVDNELRIPDLEHTIETKNFLLKLKAAIDGDSIRSQAREALRLDIGERLRAVRDKMSTELSFGGEDGCLRAAVNRIEVTSVHPHASYLRLYVALTGQSSVYLPCPPPVVAR